VDKPFRVGDRIRVDQVEGNVEAIGMRSTRVRTADGHLVSIPNKAVGNATIVNITKRPNIRTVMNIGITYDTPAEKVGRAVKVLEEIVKGDPMTVDAWVTFRGFGDFSLNLEVVHFYNSTDWRQYLKGLEGLNLRVKEAFDREGIDFAFPTQTIHLKETNVPGEPGGTPGRS
jgi:MscS family membrane protein